MANVDAYGGNSGSMVVSQTTGMIEGILVRGNQDFVSGPGGCLQSNVCPDSGCPSWEEISKTTTFASSIPELGLQFTPVGQITHTGVVGGPFNDETFQITIDNPTSSPADYSVSIAAGAQHTVLLNGSGGPVMGTVPAGGNTSVTATLSGAAGMPAGIYTTTINLDDLTNSRMLSLDSVLEVGQTGIDVSPATDLVTGGPTGGPFTGTQMYTITSTRPTPVTVDVTADQSWISLNGSASPLSINLNGVGDMAVVTVGIDSSANGLANGLYTGTVTFDNVEGTIGDTSRMASLDVGRFIYEDANVNLPISDNSTIETTLNVPDAFCVADLDVEINITHTYIGDLIVELDSPQGTTVRLHDRTGGSTDDLVVTYDNEAGTQPDGPGDLIDFDGEIATGVWTLRVSDNAGGDVGTLNSWKLKIASQSSGCLPVANDVTLDVTSNVPSSVMLDGFSVNGPVTFIVDSLPANGQLFHSGGSQITSAPATLTGDTLTYRPNENFAGLDSFTYHTDDGQSSPIATVTLGVGRTVLASFPMDSDPGWSREGQWDFGVPAGVGGDPTSGFTGTNVFGYNLNGEYANSIPQYSATTGVIDASAASNVTLDFERWLGVESSTYDHASIEAFDGTTWQQIWDHTSGSFNDGAWVHQNFDISAHADGNSALQLRWIMGTTDSSVTYAGWNIDDVVLRGFVAPSGGYCLADANQNGTLEASDFTAWIAAFNAGDAVIADQNLDGTVTPADFTAWIANFNAGCP
ncbi:MAG TPA: hypothetical protein ENJ00_04570 [Phycisphaerales bacterium]|nr:hypothetical protein [Phycisphaerales bacterium]